MIIVVSYLFQNYMMGSEPIFVYFWLALQLLLGSVTFFSLFSVFFSDFKGISVGICWEAGRLCQGHRFTILGNQVPLLKFTVGT